MAKNSAQKPKRRRVVPYGEEAMRSYSIRLSEEQKELLISIGGGNLSAGARIVMERAEDVGLGDEDQKKPKSGLPIVKKISKKRGHPSLSEEKILSAQAMYLVQGLSVKEICSTLGIHSSTFYKYVDVKKK